MMRNGGQLLVESLIAQGARRGFGVPGESYLAVLDAFFDHRQEFQFVICRQEGGAAYMADAWAKLTGEVALAFVTRGPGATNASVGVHAAMQGSTPMILFVGQANSGHLGREAFQEIDYVATFSKMAKWVVEVDRCDRIPEIVGRAWTLAQSGRPGPVVVSLPEDVLSGTTDVLPLARLAKLAEPAPDAEAIEQAVALLRAANRPLLMVGGSGWTDAGLEALSQFGEESDIPVVSAMRYHDLYDNHARTFIGQAGAAMQPHVGEAIKGADVILALNTRFGEFSTGGYRLLDVPHPQQKLIHAHPSAAELGKVYQADVGLVSGPNAMSLAMRSSQIRGPWGAWRQKLRSEFEAALVAPEQPGTLDMGAVMLQLQERLPKDAIITSGAGNATIWNNNHFAYGPDQRLLAPQSGTMGYGVPAAIAACIEHPGRAVVCVAGDGDFQMSMGELGTALQFDAMPVILLVNNASYGTIRMHQERDFPDRISGTEIVNPDYQAMAAAYGMFGARIERTEDFESAFEKAITSPTGALLELIVDVEAITPTKTLSQFREATPKGL